MRNFEFGEKLDEVIEIECIIQGIVSIGTVAKVLESVKIGDDCNIEINAVVVTNVLGKRLILRFTAEY